MGIAELSFRETGQHFGRNQGTVMLICHLWMSFLGQSHPPRCTIARDDKRITRMTVMDHAATSRAIAQHIWSFTYHSVSACTIRSHLKQKGMRARHSLLR
ncbi:uncharacterized protein TNCV_4924331 [Trichonephila clavipes]|nr:uncharacterized protein TNCV_4924331 [Trichonephila clavipes]